MYYHNDTNYYTHYPRRPEDGARRSARYRNLNVNNVLTSENSPLSSSQSVACAKERNEEFSYTVGFFTSKVTFGEISLSSANQAVYVAKSNSRGAWVWAVKVADITPGGTIGNLYISSSCEGEDASKVKFSATSYSGNYIFPSETLPNDDITAQNFVGQMDGEHGTIEYVHTYSGAFGGFLASEFRKGYICGTFNSAEHPSFSSSINVRASDSSSAYLASFDSRGWSWVSESNTDTFVKNKKIPKGDAGAFATSYRKREGDIVVAGNYRNVVYFDTMKLDGTNSEFVNSFLAVSSTNGVWKKVVQFPNREFNTFCSTDTDLHGNTYCIGMFDKTVSFGRENIISESKSKSGYFLVCFDRSLEVKWTRSMVPSNSLPQHVSCSPSVCVDPRGRKVYAYIFFSGTLKAGKGPKEKKISHEAHEGKGSKNISSCLLEYDGDGDLKDAVLIDGFECPSVGSQNPVCCSEESVWVTGEAEEIRVNGKTYTAPQNYMQNGHPKKYQRSFLIQLSDRCV